MTLAALTLLERGLVEASTQSSWPRALHNHGRAGSPPEASRHERVDEEIVGGEDSAASEEQPASARPATVRPVGRSLRRHGAWRMSNKAARWTP